jgi:hypothetical protein
VKSGKKAISSSFLKSLEELFTPFQLSAGDRKITQKCKAKSSVSKVKKTVSGKSS